MWIKTTQNPKKNVAAIVAVSIVFGIMMGLGIQTTEAIKSKGNPLNEINSKKVCGDRLCSGLPTAIQTTKAQLNDRTMGGDSSEPQMLFDIEETDNIGEIDRNDPTAPSSEALSIEKYKTSTYQQDSITYKIVYSITAGEENLVDIQIRAVTDMGVWNFDIPALSPGETSTNVVRIKALDPDSITGEIIGYTIRGDPTARFQ